MAVNFRKNRTSILGMIVPQIVHHFFSTTISGALEAAKKRGYSILLAQSYDHLKEEILASQYLLGMGVDGLLISVSNETKEAEHLQAFLDEGKAVVQFETATENLLPTYLANFSSNSKTFGPDVIQPERKTSATAAMVASSIVGFVKGMNG